MLKNELDNTLRHYCDAILIYDFAKDLIFMYYDKVLPEYENKWYSLAEIGKIHGSGRFYETDISVMRNNLSRDALRSFCESDTDSKKFEVKVRHKDGALYWYEVIIQKISDERISISYKNTYGEILNSSIQNAMENVFENILYIDTERAEYTLHCITPENKDIFINHNYNKMIAEYIKKYVVKEEIKTAIEQTKLENVIKELDKHETFSIYITTHSKDKNIEYKKLTFAYIGSNKKIITLIKTDVSDIVKEYNSQIKLYKRASYKDALTGAFNRKYYEENLKNNKASCGIAMLDIDDFKLCNDVYGHLTGDKVLAAFVKTVSDCLGENDVIVKYGGDEFLLLMRDITDANKLDETLKEIQKSTGEIYIENFPDIRLTASIGGVVAYNARCGNAGKTS